MRAFCLFFFFFQAEDGIRDWSVTGVQTCALPISPSPAVVREAVPAYGTDAFGAARRAQLERDLARSPAERLRIAEAAARTARAHRAPRGRRHRSEERRVGKEGRREVPAQQYKEIQ